MRAAVLTTALVIASLAFWASVRQVHRSAGMETPSAARLPDVAADGDARYETAAQAGREHVVAAGETLADIAQRYYGDAARADEIFRANRDRIADRDALRAGEVLRIP